MAQEKKNLITIAMQKQNDDEKEDDEKERRKRRERKKTGWNLHAIRRLVISRLQKQNETEKNNNVSKQLMPTTSIHYTDHKQMLIIRSMLHMSKQQPSKSKNVLDSSNDDETFT